MDDKLADLVLKGAVCFCEAAFGSWKRGDTTGDYFFFCAGPHQHEWHVGRNVSGTVEILFPAGRRAQEAEQQEP